MSEGPPRPRIVALGTVSLDTIERGGERGAEGGVERSGERNAESGGEIARDVLGGSAPYFGAAARHSSDVALLGVVGDDFPDELLNPLRELGVDVSGIERRPGETFRWHARYHPDGSRETLGTNRDRALRAVPSVPESLRHPRALFLGSTDPRTQAAVLMALGTPELIVLDTMIHWVRQYRDEFLEVARRAHLVLMAEDEAIELGHGDVEAAVSQLLHGGCSWVVVKRGAAGSTAFGNECTLTVTSPRPSAAVDPTGAGDAFAGGLVDALFAHGSVAPSADAMESALRRASVLGSLAVEDFSLSCLLRVARAEVEARSRAVQVEVRGIDSHRQVK